MINNKKIYVVSQHPMRVGGTDFYSDKGKVLRKSKTGRVDSEDGGGGP
jgi:hypothetical protein